MSHTISALILESRSRIWIKSSVLCVCAMCQCVTHIIWKHQSLTSVFCLRQSNKMLCLLIKTDLICSHLCHHFANLLSKFKANHVNMHVPTSVVGNLALCHGKFVLSGASTGSLTPLCCFSGGQFYSRTCTAWLGTHWGEEMAIGSQGADRGTVFIDTHAVMGSSCEGAWGVPLDTAFMCSFPVVCVLWSEKVTVGH